MKKVIKFMVNNTPRIVLQNFVHFLTPFTSVFYSGSRYRCPVCGHGFRKMMPYGYAVVRENAMCPSCLSLERHRLMWIYLRRETTFFDENPLVLHVAPERCFMRKFSRHLEGNYITADLKSPLAKVKMDIQDIPFENNTFDVIFCNHILEHVDDDRLAASELHRVMKPGGWGIIMCPVTKGLAVTREDPSVDTPEKRFREYGQSDHVREYGDDYPKRLEGAGFRVESIDYAESLTPEEKEHYCLTNEIIFLVRKDPSEVL